MRTIFLDLETVPDPSVGWELASDFPPPFAHKVVCAGFLVVGDGRPVATTTAGDETDLLCDVFADVRGRDDILATWCGRTFDVPVLVARGLMHGLSWPWLYQTKGANYRYDTAGHWDVADDVSLFGAGRTPKLDHAAKAIGLPGKIGGQDGSSVAAMVNAGQLEDVKRYCLEDVVQTAIVASRVRLFKGTIGVPQHRAFVEAVLALPCAARVAEGADLGRLMLGGSSERGAA